MGVDGSSPSGSTSYFPPFVIISSMKFGIVFKKDKSFLRSSPAERGAGLKKENNKAQEVAKSASSYLKSKGHDVYYEKDLGKADFILTFGGDGTLIHKACELASQGVPLVGINTGNLGFLTTVESGDWKQALDKLISGNYFISERLSLDATIGKGKEVYRAINEVVIKGLYRVVDLEIKIGGEKFLKVLGDGVIVATQTGSTAYSLSAGGPIVDPNLDSILITPINPIGLPIPSAVISPEDDIEVNLIKGDDVSLVLDGQEHTRLSEGDRVKVKSGKYKIKFVYFDKHQFIKSLNAKFGLASRAGG